MFDEELEKRIGMDLACRAYLYDLLHEVFGGDCSSDSIARYFGKQTREMIAHEAVALSDCSREANIAALSAMERARLSNARKPRLPTSIRAKAPFTNRLPNMRPK